MRLQQAAKQAGQVPGLSTVSGQDIKCTDIDGDGWQFGLNVSGRLSLTLMLLEDQLSGLLAQLNCAVLRHACCYKATLVT